MKWWGWGVEEKSFGLEKRPDLLALLDDRLGPLSPDLAVIVPLEGIYLPEPRIPNSVLDALSSVIGGSRVSTDRQTRLHHSLGKSYPDLVRIRRGQIDLAPDVVLFPQDGPQVEALLRFAADENLSVVPFGGGTSVVGGIEPRLHPQASGAITLDLTGMNRVLDIDEKSGMASLQAGLSGPLLESALGEKGFTLHHFPQSFEFSTLGGWIATRSAGQASTKYGKIEDMVLGLTLLTSQGVVKTRPVPAAATGPNIHQMIIGSEGIFGIVAEAQMRIHRLPAVRHYRGILFKSLECGIGALHAIAETTVRPAVLRLSDAEETQLSLSLQEKPASFLASFKQDFGWNYLKRKGYGQGCLLILGCEGAENAVAHEIRLARQLCKAFGGFDLGQGPGEAWIKTRFKLPYLRDDLLQRRILVDTLETATSWRHLLPLYGKVKEALAEAIKAGGMKPLVMAHISHVYPTGASLYFTVLSRQTPGHELEQWRVIKKAATDAIMAGGGTLSHHHGIGADHAPWLIHEHGTLAIQGMRALKQVFDPQGIMNPGKVL